MKREQKKNIEQLEKVMAETKKIPKEIKDKINSKAFENIVILAIIIMYLIALNFGMSNIPTDMYIKDLQVFSIMLLISSIILFEYGYKKDNEGLWLHGVEILIVSIFTLYLVYLYSIYYSSYGTLLMSVAVVYLVYYVIKILIIQRKIRTSYKKSLKDIGEIVKNKGGK